MNPEASLALAAIFGIAGGTIALMAWGAWGFFVIPPLMLAGIFLGDRL